VYEAQVRLSAEDAPLRRSHEAVLGAAMERVRADLSRRGVTGAGGTASGVGKGRPPVVIMAHAFVAGGQGSDSERDLTVGGVDRAPASVFAGADYVALGHLHGPQVVKGAAGQLLRYSGSPLAFSFSETGHTKSTAVVHFDGGIAGAELVPAPVPRPLAQVKGRLEVLESSAADHLVNVWLDVTVTDPTWPEDLAARLRRRFPHLLKWGHEPEGLERARSFADVTRASQPQEVAAQFIEYAGGAPAAPEELAEVESALAAARKGGTK
ncbi:MAG: exonuclease SbcCD subunit D C-terminal domain-containing protein, partial [Bifidobacteriaceae bacterium]|jgi:exonuclease SbcD|nr:exonuclease SbcCD subunit D C-terminal domain-containing protein [Bifidobacteriaceae bacterium]